MVDELKRITDKLNEYARRLEFLGWGEFLPTTELLNGRECKVVHCAYGFGKIRIAELPHLIGKATLGLLNRSEDYQLFLQRVSSHQAVLSVDRGALIMRDCDSLNGTFVNGIRLSNDNARVLNDGDQLTFGDLRFTLSLRPPAKK